MAPTRFTAALLLVAGLCLAGCANGGESLDAAATTTVDEVTTSTVEEAVTTTEADDGTSGDPALSPGAEETADILDQAFEPSTDEAACIYAALAENPELFEAVDDPLAEPEVIAEAFGVTKECLEDDTLAGAFTAGLLEEAPELTDAQAECLTEGFLAAPDEVLVDLIIADNDPLATPSDATMVTTFQLMGECDLGSLFASDMAAGMPGLTEEQLACFGDAIFALEPDLVLELMAAGEDPTAQPSGALTAAMLDIFDRCGIDPGTL